jgi:hypothetical protein
VRASVLPLRLILVGGLAAALLGGAGCGGPASQLRWNLRFATAGGRGLLVLHTRDVEVAERVTMKLCGEARTELLAESENSRSDRRDFRAVFPLTPTSEACLAQTPRVTVAIDSARPGAGPQTLPLDDWSSQRIYERVQERALNDLERATATAKELDAEKYLAALASWVRAHPRSLALEQARKEMARVQGELAAERRAAAERARAEEARRRAEAERRAYVERGFAAVANALEARDHVKAAAALAVLAQSLSGEAELATARRLRVQVDRLRKLAELRARYSPRLVPRPRKLYLQRRVLLHELPDAQAPTGVELEEGDEVWALAAAGQKMVGVARTAHLDLTTILAGVKLEQVEGWVEAAALTPRDRWTESRRAREEQERALLASHPEADRPDLKRLLAVGTVISPRVQLGLLRQGLAPAETRRLAVLLDTVIRAAANRADPRMPAICSGLRAVVQAKGLLDCTAAARAGATDENVTAVARDFGRNSAGFASTFGIAREDLAKRIMAVAAGVARP